MRPIAAAAASSACASRRPARSRKRCGLTIYVAHSNGNGTFALRPAQTFPGEWGLFNVGIGDFNGDGKADIVLSTVCLLGYGGCSLGDTNSVVVATSMGGAFTIGARQDLGASGWRTTMLSRPT